MRRAEPYELLTVNGGIRYGAWIGLAAAVVMLAGCWGAMRDERTPGAAPPNVPRRPAP